jgi:hypothetical protein
MFAVAGNKVYKINKTWTSTAIGTLNTNSGRVGMIDNGKQVGIVDGTGGYTYVIPDPKTTPPLIPFNSINAPGFTGATNIVFQDGYGIVNTPATGQFNISGNYDLTAWDALDFATAEGQPDDLVTVLDCQRKLWLFGTETTEIWWDSGAADFPFSRYGDTILEYGCAAAFSAVVYANTVIWLGSGQNADGVVWMANGLQPQRISNHAVESIIQGCGDVSLATAYAMQFHGHNFYVLNLPNASSSLVYDISTQQWHEWAYLGATGQLERFRADSYCWFNHTHVMGDYQNGNLYAFDETVHTDNGTPIKGVRRSPYISADMKRVFHTRFDLAALMGTGLDGTGQGTAPTVSLRYSDDLGHSWSTERTRPLGQIGVYKNRAYWDRLGQSRSRVYEISWTDPVKVVLQGAELTVQAGS